MIPFSKLNLTDVIFTHIDDKTNKHYHYAISRIRPQLANGLMKGWAKPTKVPVEEEVAKFCITNRGVELHRIMKLLPAKLPYEPIIFAEMGDGTHLLLDGTHRYVVSALRKLPDILAIIINNKHRKRFLIKDFPFPD